MTQERARNYLFTYDEVKSLLCDLCACGVRSALDNGTWYHYANGHAYSCSAAKWRTKAHDYDCHAVDGGDE